MVSNHSEWAQGQNTAGASSGEPEMEHANKHIPAFLRLPVSLDHELVQVLNDGKQLTTENFKSGKLSLQRPVVIHDTPQSIGMRVPKNNSVRGIADTVGHATPVHVIDVEYQEEMEGWTFADLVEYFEDEERVMAVATKEHAAAILPAQPSVNQERRQRPSRKAAAHFMNKTRHRVLNQISYEFSRTPLASRVRSPAFVRDVDWIDTAWPKSLREQGTYPVVQYYCLTSAAGCYTDFHLDFGGTSVWYHILSGEKDFCLIPPTEENLQSYEEWLCRKDQAHVFLPEMISNQNEVLRVQLKEGQTMIIPAGWIHSVYTPVDSLVFGGNFLHGLDIKVQLQVYSIEVRTKVLDRFRFPYFKPLQFYAGGMYLEKLRKGDVCMQEVNELSALVEALEAWWKVRSDEGVSQPGATVEGAALYAASQANCETVHEFLRALEAEVERTLKEGISPAPVQPEVTTRIAKNTPKLRLKLSSRASPKQSLEEDESVGGFRITLSTSSRRTDPIPPDVKVARNKPREDLASFVDEREMLKDDEWVPPVSSRRAPAIALPRRGSNHSNNGPPSPKRRKKTTTARQRLFKKTR